MLQKIHYLLDRSADFSIETTLATRSLLGIINEAKEKGYKITLLYLWLNSPELAIARVKERVRNGGHNIKEEVIRRRYKMGLLYFFDTYSSVCDRWILADNSKTPFTVVAEGQGQLTFIKNYDKYHLIWNLVHPYDEL